MPIIVDPTTPNPAPTEIIYSPSHDLAAWATETGIQLRANFQTSLGVWPADIYKVRFEANGVPVRSGNDAWAVGGIADAFDLEVAPSEAVAYQAFPLTIDGEPAGDPTDQLVITAAPLDARYDCWLKSISDPTLQLRLEMQGDPAFTEDGSDSLEKPLGSALYAGGIDTAAEADSSFQFKVEGKEDLVLLRRILGSGTVLWQSDGRAGLDNFYGVRQTASWPYHVGSHKLVWLVPVVFRKVPRPSPYGAPLIIPGRSFGDTQITAPTFEDRQLAFPAFQDTLGIPVLTPEPA